MTEKEKMIAGELYDPMDPELVEARRKAHDLCYRLGAISPSHEEELAAIIEELLGRKSGPVYITPPFYCDYGFNIQLGKSFYCNTACVILDCAPVTIGDNVLLGPMVQIYTAAHPLDPDERQDLEYAKAITIGDRVWIGGGSILCPGSEVGEGSVIGAGSVVTGAIPSFSVAVGNPCRVIRKLR